MSDPPASTLTLTARWVFPVSGPPLERGTVTINADQIVAVERKGCRKLDLDLGNSAILPGLVNAHTHLDLSDAGGKCPPTLEFADWLAAVVQHRRSQTAEQVQAAIGAGLAESLRFGTTLLGDISVGGSSWGSLAKAPVRSVVFYELLGLAKPRAEQAWSAALGWLQTLAATETCRPGLSPHAPYSVGDLAAPQGCHGCEPLAIAAGSTFG